jgi:DNA-binding MarR family transcriptional regulator
MKEAEQLVEELGRLSTATALLEPDDLHLTATQKLALAELAGGETLRLMELARRIGTTDPTASRAVDGLVTLGLVERHDDPDDRRALRLAATATGKRWVKRRRRLVAAALHAPLAALKPAERRRLVELLARLNAAL